jgi:hypothetical protein
VLSQVDNDLRSAFAGKLSSEWLRGKSFDLLYRGSRDGMTPAVFHDKCDGKGPTLVLIAGQSEGQPVCVFGGYASESWERGPAHYWDVGMESPIDARDSFVFTVLNPFGDGIVKMSVNYSSRWAHTTLYCYPSYGPDFGNAAIALRTPDDSATTEFCESSYCSPSADDTFGDPLGRGQATFTGARNFTPVELEVWRVI